MSECKTTIDRLTAYVDGHLSSAELADVTRHLNACEPCRRLAAAERGGQSVLRHVASRLRTTTLPPGLRTRCEALAREQSALRSQPGSALAIRGLLTNWRSTLVPTVLGVIFLVFTASALLSVATRRSDAVLAAQLTADHSKCFLLSGADVPADAHDVERMLSTQYGWSIHVPPSSATAGVELIGARRCLYADGLIPHVMYRANGHELSLYVLNGVTRKAADLVSWGHRSRIWSRNENTYVLVSSAGDGLPDATRYMMSEAY
jgi:anti-sigma factor RsiW